ncbi:hypothetical protein [Nocardia sp. NRRL S-836]|uniref:VMAP-C domain-containing protein n=1 Tax=Nocardia sp. NRRL S-836 TaxID=1519492 RepID=UPI000A98D979
MRAGELVAGVEGWAENASSISIEFILPKDLLNLPVEQWLGPADEIAMPIGIDYPVSLRSLERSWDKEKHRRWRRRSGYFQALLRAAAVRAPARAGDRRDRQGRPVVAPRHARDHRGRRVPGPRAGPRRAPDAEGRCAHGGSGWQRRDHRGARDVSRVPVHRLHQQPGTRVPPAFLRRTLQLEMQPPNEERLASMIAAHFRDASSSSADLFRKFLRRGESEGGLAIDQLLNTVQLATTSTGLTSDRASWERLRDALWHRLSTTGFERAHGTAGSVSSTAQPKAWTWRWPVRPPPHHTLRTVCYR